MTTSTITAIITARGDATTVPDRPDAVDAEIWIGHEDHKRAVFPSYLCAVTLLEHRKGTLTTWGEPHHWCSDWRAVVDCAGEHDLDVADLVGEIVAAVVADREAAGQ